MAAATSIASDIIDEAWVYRELDVLIPRLMAEHAFAFGARNEVDVVLALRAVEVSPDEIATRLDAVMHGLRNIRSRA